MVTITELVEVPVSKCGAPFSVVVWSVGVAATFALVNSPTGVAEGVDTGGEPPFYPTKYPHPPSRTPTPGSPTSGPDPPLSPNTSWPQPCPGIAG